jgi:hypothetical protein
MLLPSKSGVAALFVAAILSAAGCYLAWRSGCVFDSKQGIGDAEVGLALSGWALASAAAACCAAVFSVFLFSGRATAVVMAGALLVALVAAPTSLALLFLAESHGADACSQ